MKKIISKNTESGTYLLQSNTELLLGKNVVVCAVKDVESYYEDDSIFRDNCGNELGRALFYARGCENVSISGEEGSLIDGKGYLWRRGESKRPSLIRFVDCVNVTIKNLKLIDSPCWCIHLQNCENVTIENVTIVSDCNANNDGIDVDCCRNVYIADCYIENGDDAIVLKSTKNISSTDITIERCVLNTCGAGFKLGTESVGDFDRIIFQNNKIVRAQGCAIKIVPVDGANVNNVLIKDVVAEKTTGPIFIANGFRQRVYFDGQQKDTLSTIKNVTIENFEANVYIRADGYADAGRGVVFVSGTPKDKIENFTLKNSRFKMPCGENDKDNAYKVGELTTQYPEYYTLGTAPAHGAYFRHIKGIEIKDVIFEKMATDAREEIVMEDVIK